MVSSLSRMLCLSFLVSCIVLNAPASNKAKKTITTEPDKYLFADTSPLNRVFNPSGPQQVDVLVMLQDTVYGSANQIALKRADNDTAMKYIAQALQGVATMMRDTNQATVPSLRPYRTVILIETSFIFPSLLRRAQRDSLKAFLMAGAPGDEKSLIVFGGDFGYNYDRADSPVLDTVFSRSLLKHRYLIDDGSIDSENKIRGLAVNTALSDSLLAEATNFYPDAVRKLSGADSLYGYAGRGIRDSLGGVGFNGTTYNAAVIFADPRYIVAKTGDSTGGFRRVLAGALTYIRNSGGTTTVRAEPPVSDSYELLQNYPNPFNPTTTVQFHIPHSTVAMLDVFDMLGRKVATLVNGRLAAGRYVLTFSPANLSSGVYFYRLSTPSVSITKGMVFTK